MARYRRIDPYIWHDERFTDFSDDAKLLFFHLLTSPRGNPLGCFVQGKSDMAEYLKWPMKRLAEPFRILLLSGRLHYDEKTRLLLIVNYLKYNPLENENQAKMAAKYLTELPTHIQWFQYLKQYLEQYNRAYLKPLLDGLTNRIGNGTPNTEPYSLASALSLSTEPEPQIPPISPPVGGTPSRARKKISPHLNGNQAPLFERFMAAYPRKEAKQDAVEAWTTIEPPPDETLVDRMLTVIEAKKHTKQWIEGIIPLPATWLNKRRWEDEVPRTSGLSTAAEQTKANMERLKQKMTPGGGDTP